MVQLDSVASYMPAHGEHSDSIREILEWQLITFGSSTKDKVSSISELGPGGAWHTNPLHIKLSVLPQIRESGNTSLDLSFEAAKSVSQLHLAVGQSCIPGSVSGTVGVCNKLLHLIRRTKESSSTPHKGGSMLS